MGARRVWMAALMALGLSWWVVAPEASAGEPAQGSGARVGEPAQESGARARSAGRAGAPRARKGRRRARRGRRWSPVQATVALGVVKATQEDKGEPIGALAQGEPGNDGGARGVMVTGFGGVPLGGYKPGGFLVLGLRGEPGGCGEGCRLTALGPALRLGTATGSRRRAAPDMELYAEGALLLTADGGRGASGGKFLRLGLGLTAPKWTVDHLRVLKNPRRTEDLARAFLLPFNHVELVAWWDAQEPGPPRIGVMIGGGL